MRSAIAHPAGDRLVAPYIAPRQSGDHRRVRFKVAWSHYRVGDEIVPDGMLRSWLIQNGYAVAAPPTAAPERLLEAPANRAMDARGKRGARYGTK